MWNVDCSGCRLGLGNQYRDMAGANIILIRILSALLPGWMPGGPTQPEMQGTPGSRVVIPARTGNYCAKAFFSDCQSIRR